MSTVITGFCMKCRKKQPMSNVVKVTFKMKNGKERSMGKGVCPVCGTKMCKILSAIDNI